MTTELRSPSLVASSHAIVDGLHARRSAHASKAEQEARDLLARTSPDALVQAVIRLTHRIHRLNEAGRPEAAASLRQQRDRVRAELVRRCGE